MGLGFRVSGVGFQGLGFRVSAGDWQVGRRPHIPQLYVHELHFELRYSTAYHSYTRNL